MAVGVVSCSNTDNMAPWTAGGPGQVVTLSKDAGHADGGRDAAMPSSTGGHGGTALGTGGTGVGVGGSAGAHAAAGESGAAGAGGVGGAAGSGPQDDPCTACEKSRCSHPDLSGDNPATGTVTHAELVAAYEVCFIGTGWPSATLDPSVKCLPGETGTTAIDGPASGTAKTILCQALLQCIHQSKCPGPDDNETDCYCGAGVDITTCRSAGFSPTGACASQVAAALESTEFSTSGTYYFDPCLANGAAFFIYDNCDANCCEEECGLTPSGDEDLTLCNAAGTGGAAGAGGTIGTGGATGTGGVQGTGGTTGTGGVVGTGGVQGAGGTTGTGGVVGTGGVSGTGGVTSTGGVQGTGGTTSTGGLAGSAGSSGSTGGSSGSSGAGGLQNATFNTNTVSWTPDSGATISWSTNDAGGSALSGSLDLEVTGDPTIGVQAAAVQCISASPGASYSLDADILIPTGSSSYASLWFYGSNDCSGSALSVVASTPSFTTVTAWQEVFASASAPSGAHSAGVHLQVEKSVGQSSGEALFDNVMVTSQ